MPLIAVPVSDQTTPEQIVLEVDVLGDGAEFEETVHVLLAWRPEDLDFSQATEPNWADQNFGLLIWRDIKAGAGSTRLKATFKWPENLGVGEQTHLTILGIDKDGTYASKPRKWPVVRPPSGSFSPSIEKDSFIEASPNKKK